MEENGKLNRMKGSCIQSLGGPQGKNCSKLVSHPGRVGRGEEMSWSINGTMSYRIGKITYKNLVD